MSHESNPVGHDRSYSPARGPVLLLTCMDVRLLDEIFRFMDHDGLNNRYDHVILAGAALGAIGGCEGSHAHWRRTFFDHLGVAHKLHQIKDVYILEHRDCGAYRDFLGDDGDFGDGAAEWKREFDCHLQHAKRLHKEIGAWTAEHAVKLRVKSFLMDLRGKVEILHQSEHGFQKRATRKPRA